MPPFIPKLKSFLQAIPFPVGVALSNVPYSWRPGYGRLYRVRRLQIKEFDGFSEEAQRQFVLQRMKIIVEHAWNNVEFYRHYYEKQGFHPEQLRHFNDLSRIPVVSKKALVQWDLEKRSYASVGRYLVNTGGSSGSTLAFYVQPSAISHEWAHVHHAWSHLGYCQRDLKLGFSGWWNMGKLPFQYDGLRHQFAMNIFCDFPYMARCLKPVLKKHAVRFLHGYPSSIYEFACYCEQDDHELRDMLRAMLRGVLFSSEYPAPPYRKMVESTFAVRTLSFYGHTERAILASEKDRPYVFYPLHTYGFAEAVKDPATGVCKLVGTSYYNTASPLIRYDTADEISVEEVNGEMLRSFRIDAGREGDYIVDRKGKRIALTGLVFGRHHMIFNYASFVQIAQSMPGEAVFYVTRRSGVSLPDVIQDAFDTGGVDISFSCRILEKPIVTGRGKIPLKVCVQPEVASIVKLAPGQGPYYGDSPLHLVC